MRFRAVAMLACALTACGGDGDQLAASNSEVSPAQVDAALGPADQTSVQDALPADEVQNGLNADVNRAATATNSAEAEGGQER